MSDSLLTSPTQEAPETGQPTMEISDEAAKAAEAQIEAPKAVETPEAPISAPSPQSLMDMLPEDLREEKGLADFKDVGALAKSYINAQKMIGKSIRIPGEDAGKEQIEEFYNKLSEVPGIMRAPNPEDSEAMADVYNKIGRPDSAENYKLDLDDAQLEELGIKDDINSFKKTAHELGLTNAQAKALVKTQIDKVVQQISSTGEEVQNAEKALKEKWGKDYEKRLHGANLALKHLAAKDQAHVEALLNSGAGNNPVVISLLSEYANKLTEAGALKNDSSVKYGVSKEEALAQLEEIRGNLNHPYYDQYAPAADREAAVAKVNRLSEIAYGDN